MGKNRLHTCVCSAVLGSVLLFTGPVRAQVAEPIDAAWLATDAKVVGLDFRFGRTDEEIFSVTSLIFEAFGHIPVTPEIIVHGRLPFELSIASDGGESESVSGLGNIQLGARYSGVAGQLRFGAGVTVGLPTADDDGEGLIGSLISSAFMAPIDLARFGPNVTLLGFDGAFRFGDGRWFFQGDIDLDLMFVEDSDDTQLLYLRAAGGFLATDQLSLLLGFHNLFVLEDADDNTFHALAPGLVYETPAVRVAAHIYLPLDDLGDLWGFGVGVGAKF